MKELQLIDCEQNKTYSLMVSDDNYEEIVTNNNLTLAASLLKKEQEKENFKAAFYLMQNDQPSTSYSLSNSNVIKNSSFGDNEKFNETVTSEATPEPDDACLNYLENGKIWSDDATKLLIKLYEKYEAEFEKGIKKYVWNKVAKELTEKLNHSYSAQQCETKWKLLKNRYKQLKKLNEQSGNSRKDWKYFSLMEEILFSRPEINAPVTCSSKRGLLTTPEHNLGILRDDGFAENICQNISGSNDSQSTSFHSSFMRKRKTTENAVERRHKEKMARQDRYLEILDRLTAAVERSNNGNP